MRVAIFDHGTGGPEHIRAAFAEGRASTALSASILHDALTTAGAIKKDLAQWGMESR